MVGEALYGTLEAKRETTLSARMHGHLIKVVFLGFGAVKSGKRCLYASAASAVHSRVYRACTAEAAASETSGLSVGGCSLSSRVHGDTYLGRTLYGTVKYSVVFPASQELNWFICGFDRKKANTRSNSGATQKKA